MDQIEEIRQKCIELGKSIAQTTFFHDYKKAEYELLSNPRARKLIGNLQKMKIEQRGKLLAGLELTQAEKDELQELEKSCANDPQVQLTNNANTQFQEFMEKITGKIKEGIKSVDVDQN